jgi:hypothetical protein
MDHCDALLLGDTAIGLLLSLHRQGVATGLTDDGVNLRLRRLRGRPADTTDPWG